ncbi:MAG: ribosomal RNA small subunit methyltransferase A [Gaiellaceae bacterium]
MPQARPGGRHLLRSRRLAEAIVADAGIAAGDLVVEIGAGSGMLTAPLLAAGASVLALEPDPRLAARLRRACPAAEVVAADALYYRWPETPFRVVANLPFAHAAEICRTLLGDPQLPLRAADLIVEWDFAAKRARLWPSTAQTVVWSAWYELAVVRRLEPAAFVPVPSVAAGVLRARRRERPLVHPADAVQYERFVRAGFRGPRARERDPHAWALEWKKEPSGRARTVTRMTRRREAR